MYADVHEGTVLCNEKLNRVYHFRSHITRSTTVTWTIFGFKTFFDSNSRLNVPADAKINLLPTESILNLTHKSQII